MSKRTITFGTWGGKPIEWIVLKEESYGTLVLSRLALFAYNWSSNDRQWKECGLRKYLNTDFWNKAFTEDEKKKVVNVVLNDSENAKDNVFLLSMNEVETLMTQDERKCGNGFCNGHSCSNCYQYSNQHGTCYFLRKSGNVVHPNGTLTTDYYDLRSVRPAMWVKES